MSVLVDTSVWSLALRRRTTDATDPVAAQLQTLIQESRAALIGPIRQEVLSGIRDSRQFSALRETLHTFPDIPLETTDYERAAEYFNLCRAKGVQGAHTDFLICAVAVRNDIPIFTTDRDFARYAKYLDIRLQKTD